MGTNYYGKQISKLKEIDDQHKRIVEGVSQRMNDTYYELDCIISEYFLIKRNEIKDIHIGKQSMGWRFLCDHNDWQYFNDKQSFVEWLYSLELYDEYGKSVTAEEILHLIETSEDHPQSASHILKYPEYYIEKDGLRFSSSTDFS